VKYHLPSSLDAATITRSDSWLRTTLTVCRDQINQIVLTVENKKTTFCTDIRAFVTRTRFLRSTGGGISVRLNLGSIFRGRVLRDVKFRNRSGYLEPVVYGKTADLTPSLSRRR
jgi:hypothetical protein